MNRLSSDVKKCKINSKNLLLLVFAFEFSIAATATSEPIKMFGHECALFAPGAGSFVGGYLSRLVDFVHVVCLGHYSSPSFFLGSFLLTIWSSSILFIWVASV